MKPYYETDLKKRIEFKYLLQPPKKYTFEQLKLKSWVESHCTGTTLNLFAGKTMLDIPEVRVDINPKMPATYHMDAYEFVELLIPTEKVDTIILDPPYSYRKSKTKYGNCWIGNLPKLKNKIPYILNPGGKVISLGYDSVGMSRRRGFEKIAICLVCHGGDHKDTICVVEKYIQPVLFNGQLIASKTTANKG